MASCCFSCALLYCACVSVLHDLDRMRDIMLGFCTVHTVFTSAVLVLPAMLCCVGCLFDTSCCVCVPCNLRICAICRCAAQSAWFQTAWAIWMPVQSVDHSYSCVQSADARLRNLCTKRLVGISL